MMSGKTQDLMYGDIMVQLGKLWWLQKADEANLYFELLRIKGRMTRLAPLIPRARALGEFRVLAQNKANNQEFERVKQTIISKLGLTGLGEYEMWYSFWEKYTLNMRDDQFQELATRVVYKVYAGDLLPKETFREWYNRRLKDKNAIPK